MYLLSSVSNNEANAFSNSSIVSVMSSTVYFCSIFIVCNLGDSESRTCMYCETFSSQLSVMKFGISIEMQLFITFTSEFEFLMPLFNFLKIFF